MDQFVSAVENLTPATTANVAKEVGCGYQSAYYYLNRLAEDEIVRKEKIGNSLLWRAD
jgi:predicted transcriptional regulator